MAQMIYRTPARLGHTLSAIGQGCWQLGADWGEVSASAAQEVLTAAYQAGVNFFDTADVYGDGRSERLVAEFAQTIDTATRAPIIATKTGRRANPFTPESYTEENIRAWVERSRTNLNTDTLDLVQLHCPPTPVYSNERVLDLMETLVAEQKIAAWGVSVETCDEAKTALQRESLASLQIIVNPFRLKPLEEVLPLAESKGVAVISRVPLASGLLSGRYTAQTTFAENDHRTYNRQGEAFDRGETFSGVDFATGLEAVSRLSEALAGRMSLPEATLRWIIQQPGITTVIPGARNAEQARANAAAGSELTDAQAEILKDFDHAVHGVYAELLKDDIHPRW